MSPSSPYPDVPGLTKRDLDDATSIIKDIKDGTFDIKRLDLMSRFGIDRSALLRHEVTDVPQYLSDNSLDLYLQVVKAAAMLRHEEQVRLYVCASLFRLFVTNLAGFLAVCDRLGRYAHNPFRMYITAQLAIWMVQEPGLSGLFVTNLAGFLAVCDRLGRIPVCLGDLAGMRITLSACTLNCL